MLDSSTSEVRTVIMTVSFVQRERCVTVLNFFHYDIIAKTGELMKFVWRKSLKFVVGVFLCCRL